ncbi:deoxyribodipyrimidine photo-lyase [Planctomicrobium sp. SH664]|uniref:deoxyribodipyrimidine photo-lyase n=1 Tax=Planctomicrobium sp. SH664 TaxID=3448125 RepID=UPI003F5C69DF
MSIPEIRVRTLTTAALNDAGKFVLYWMNAQRRTAWNFALQRAVDWAKELQRPLVVLETLTIDPRWSSDRRHGFVLQGMADNAAALANKPVLYYPFVEPRRHEAQKLLETLAQQACVVLTDDFPCSPISDQVTAASEHLLVKFEAIDSNGLLPLRATDRDFPTAYAFRRFLQKRLPEHLRQFPKPDPFQRVQLPRLNALPEQVLQRWPAATSEQLTGRADILSKLDLEGTIGPAASTGGAAAASRLLSKFLAEKLHRYHEHRNDVDDPVASGLSPFLHFGHLSAHEIFDRLSRAEEWTADQLEQTSRGAKEGWWGMSPGAESFLDQLTTWRELGYNMCVHRPDYDQYESLPLWARQTLADHENDPQQPRYSPQQLEGARTGDEIWNAAQRQLVRDGLMHNYLRMLWGKKILEWTSSPREALDVMVELNNRYAIDGCNPNSYSGIFWVLGRYDRAWGPERPVFGKIRYMSSDSTRRKLKLKNYLHKYAE